MRKNSASQVLVSPQAALPLLLLTLLLSPVTARAELSLRTLRESADRSNAVLRVYADRRSPHPISRYITGKFSEHLGANIYRGMDAQVLANPTFGLVPFRTGDTTPDGIMTFHVEEEKIDARVKYYGAGYGWPNAEFDNLVADQKAGLATFWTRVGSYLDVLPSPDTGPSGSRAQRVEVAKSGQGIEQWISFPLHRAREYEFEIFLRSPGIKSFTVSLSQGSNNPVFVTHIKGVSSRWQKFTGRLQADSTFSTNEPCRFALMADSPGQFVVQRVMVRPSDHINNADPDVVRLLKDSRLPLLRWPGGNFVSAYHWRDGVGPLERRPTVPNYAWGGLEPNHFGTDEFIQFCRDVGCEPLICINAGTGTPQEAAQWIQYCNGPTNSPMGKLRASNGHPEPYNVRYWEIGNELWGHWQANWTTPRGYADRYLQFFHAMRAADPKIELYGCGAPLHWAKDWNDTLIEISRDKLHGITDHSLIGGDVDPSVDPLAVYSDYMAAPEVLEQHWAQLSKNMSAHGIQSPRLALTELQIFAGIGNVTDTNKPVVLVRTNLVDSSTQAEALYDILLYHTAIRLAPFLGIITHSATVNHGGGLRKIDEKVYANPCYYAQTAFAALAGATPVAVQLVSPMEKAPLVVPDLRAVVPEVTFSSVDALAAISTNELWLSIVNRSISNSIHLNIELHGFEPSGSAEIRSLSADAPWLENLPQTPVKIVPMDATASVRNGRFSLALKPYSVLRVRLPKKQ